MADQDVRIVELIAPKATFEVGGGRPGLFGYENEAATLRMQVGASPTANIIYLARRDAGQTFAGVQVFSGQVFGEGGDTSTASFTHRKSGAHDANRWAFGSRALGDSFARFVIKEGGLVEWGGGGARDVNLYRSAADALKTDNAFDAGSLRVAGVTRISSGGAGTLVSLSLTGMASDRIVTTGASGLLGTDGGLTRTALSGVTRLLFVGDNSVAGNAAFIARRTTGFFAGYLYQDSGSATRWSHTYDNSYDWILSAYTSAAVLIDNPISIVNAAGGAMTLSRPLKLSVHTADRVLTSGVGGEVTSDAGWQVFRVGGITRRFTIGDGAVAGFVGGLIRRSPGNDSGWAFREDVATVDVSRWELRHQGSDGNFVLSAHATAGTLIDLPFSFANAASGVMTFGGTTLRPANFTGAIQTSGVQRISGAGAASFTTLSTSGLATLAQATISDIPATRVMYGGVGGRVTGVGNLTFDDTVTVLEVGSAALASGPRLALTSAAGQSRYVRIRSGSATRWAFGGGAQAESGTNAGSDFEVLAFNDAGAQIDIPLSILRAPAGLITLGGSTSRPVSITSLLSVVGNVTTGRGFRSVSDLDVTAFTGKGLEISNVGGITPRLLAYDRTANARIELRIDGSPITFHANGTLAGAFTATGNLDLVNALHLGGVQRISSAGAASFTTLSTTGLATLAQATVSDLTTGRMVSTTTAGRLQALDAAGSRALIGAAATTDLASYQPLDAKLDAISAGETAGRFWLGAYSSVISSYGMISTTGKARFGNGVFLAIGASRTNLLRSTDFGATWTTVSPINGANTFSDVCWHSAASLWVAVGPSTCATSPDGVTWTMRTISAHSWNGLASNGTTIIAVGAGCKVAYSTNGTSWTTVTPAGIPAAGFYSACWSSVIGKFLAVGSGNVSISSNGSTWSTITNPAAGGGSWCTAVGNNFVAVDPSSGPYWSADGVTWGTPRRTPSAKANWQAIATNGAVAVIGGYSEETQAVSADGETWLPVDMGYTGSFNAVAYGGGWFVMLDDLGYTYRSRG